MYNFSAIDWTKTKTHPYLILCFVFFPRAHSSLFVITVLDTDVNIYSPPVEVTTELEGQKLP